MRSIPPPASIPGTSEQSLLLLHLPDTPQRWQHQHGGGTAGQPDLPGAQCSALTARPGSKAGSRGSSMDYEAAQLENQHVHSVYESTAPYFNEVQSKAWPKVRQFLLEQKPGSLVVDIGCGTGKYLSVNCNTYNLGCDYCEPLVEMGRNNNLEVMVCDNLNLPFRDKCFDTVISIGVIHHFSTRQRRICAIKEMARILYPGGQIMLYVWAMEQKSRRFEKQDVFVPWNKALLPRRTPETNQCENKVNSDTKSYGIDPQVVQDSESINLHNLKQTFDSKQLHNTNNCRTGETCCMKFPNDDSRLYSAIGRSIRSWFFSRSLDESTLRRQIDKMKSFSPINGWVNSAVSVQPSRHCSLDLGHQRLLLKDHSFDDDDVFIKSESHKKHQWFLALDPSKNENGRHVGLVHNDIKQNFQPEAKYCSCICSNEGDAGTQHKVLKRTSTTESSDSVLDETVAASDQEADAFDSKAYMRYYHVFREGELRSLLEDDVPELSVISSSFDHGNWCVIAEKKNLIP